MPARAARQPAGEVFGELFAVVSHVVLVLLLGMLCSGYTLVEDNTPYGQDLDLLWVSAARSAGADALPPTRQRISRSRRAWQ